MFKLLALVALGVAGLAVKKASDLAGKVERLEGDRSYRDSQLRELREELDAKVRTLATHVVQVKNGATVPDDNILDGRLWDDVDGDEARRLVDEVEGTVVIDVRTPEEFQGGHIPGAILLPVDQLEARWEEVPRDAPNVVINCAAGGRSAHACDWLSSQKGYTNLHNLAGGIGAWKGERVTGLAPAKGD